MIDEEEEGEGSHIFKFDKPDRDVGSARQLVVVSRQLLSTCSSFICGRTTINGFHVHVSPRISDTPAKSYSTGRCNAFIITVMISITQLKGMAF